MKYFLLCLLVFMNVTASAAEPTAEEMLTKLGGFNARAAEILTIMKKYQKIYAPIADSIAEITSKVVMCEFYPELLQNTPVTPIYLIGPPGVGKTTAVKKFLKELGLGRRFMSVDIKEGDTTIPVDPVLSLGLAYRTEPGVTGIYLADEIGNA